MNLASLWPACCSAHVCTKPAIVWCGILQRSNKTKRSPLQPFNLCLNEETWHSCSFKKSVRNCPLAKSGQRSSSANPHLNNLKLAKLQPFPCHLLFCLVITSYLRLSPDPACLKRCHICRNGIQLSIMLQAKTSRELPTYPMSFDSCANIMKGATTAWIQTYDNGLVSSHHQSSTTNL